MRIHVELHDGPPAVAADGRIDGTNAMEFQSTGQDALEDNKGPLPIECDTLTYINRAALRALLSIAKPIQRREGQYAACAQSGMISQMFRSADSIGSFRYMPRGTKR